MFIFLRCSCLDSNSTDLLNLINPKNFEIMVLFYQRIGDQIVKHLPVVPQIPWKENNAFYNIFRFVNEDYKKFNFLRIGLLCGNFFKSPFSSIILIFGFSGILLTIKRWFLIFPFDCVSDSKLDASLLYVIFQPYEYFDYLGARYFTKNTKISAGLIRNHDSGYPGVAGFFFYYLRSLESVAGFMARFIPTDHDLHFFAFFIRGAISGLYLDISPFDEKQKLVIVGVLELVSLLPIIQGYMINLVVSFNSGALVFSVIFVVCGVFFQIGINPVSGEPFIAIGVCLQVNCMKTYRFFSNQRTQKSFQSITDI